MEKEEKSRGLFERGTEHSGRGKGASEEEKYIRVRAKRCNTRSFQLFIESRGSSLARNASS